MSTGKEGTHMTELYSSTAEPATSATRVVNHELAKASAVGLQFPHTVQDKVKVRNVGGILFSRRHLASGRQAVCHVRDSTTLGVRCF